MIIDLKQIAEESEYNLPTIDIRRVIHYNSEVIGIFFIKNFNLIQQIRKIPGISFSKTLSGWYVKDRSTLIDEIKVVFDGIASVNTALYDTHIIDTGKENLAKPHLHKPCPEEYTNLLMRKRYSEATIKNYTSQFALFVNYYHNIDLDKLGDEEIKRYVSYLISEKKISTSTQNVVINAIKFYYEKVKGNTEKYYSFERPMKEKRLPTVLSEEEVVLLLQSCENVKHKAMLYLIYAAGLRRNELIELRICDIDEDRVMINVRGAKGNKDRITLLSAKALALLKIYYSKYEPKYWVFEGEGNKQYSPSSLQKVFKQALHKSGIRKSATLHALRHSFATHLLENGTDIRYIQTLLGHNSSKTTEIYAHVTKKGFEKIRSPLDSLDL